MVRRRLPVARWLTWIQRQPFSSMSWSQGRRSRLMSASRRRLPEREPTVMSAASPRWCWLVGVPPTSWFNSGQRQPLLTLMGPPHASRSGSSTLSTSACSALTALAGGVLSMPWRRAVADRVSSRSVKYFIGCGCACAHWDSAAPGTRLRSSPGRPRCARRSS